MNKRIFEYCKNIPLPDSIEQGKEYIYFNYVSKKKDFKRPTIVTVTDSIKSSSNTLMLAVTIKGKKGTLCPNTWTIFDKKYMKVLETQYFRLLNFYNPDQLLKRDLKFMSDFETKYPEHTI